MSGDPSPVIASDVSVKRAGAKKKALQRVEHLEIS